jgi:DivIVA domain-containing protein
VLSAVVFVVSVLLVGGLLFLLGSFLLGRGETLPPAEPDRSPVELPADRPVTGDDVRALRISVTARGYRMTEVDWLLDQLAETIEERDRQIAELRARPGPPEEPPRTTHDPTTPDPITHDTAASGNGAPPGAHA